MGNDNVEEKSECPLSESFQLKDAALHPLAFSSRSKDECWYGVHSNGRNATQGSTLGALRQGLRSIIHHALPRAEAERVPQVERGDTDITLAEYSRAKVCRVELGNGLIIVPSIMETALLTNIVPRPKVNELTGKYLSFTPTTRAPTYTVGEHLFKGMNEWITSATDDRYEGNPLGFLRRRDGNPVGWMPLLRYGEIMGVPRAEIMTRFAQGDKCIFPYNVDGYPKRQHPYYRRVMDVQPFMPTINHLSVQAIAVPMDSGIPKTLGLVQSLIHDELGLVDFTRAFAWLFMDENPLPWAPKTKHTPGWSKRRYKGGRLDAYLNVQWLVLPEVANPFGLTLRHDVDRRGYRRLFPAIDTKNTHIVSRYTGAPDMNDPVQVQALISQMIQTEIAAEMSLHRRKKTAATVREKYIVGRSIEERTSRNRIIADYYTMKVARKPVTPQTITSSMAAAHRLHDDIAKAVDKFGLPAQEVVSSFRVKSIADAIAALRTKAEEAWWVDAFVALPREPQLTFDYDITRINNDATDDPQ
jgi:hypothetical protein